MHTEANQLSRVIPLEGAYNVRDLGGYSTKEGKETKWGVFLRADGLHRLTPVSMQTLVDRGVSTVIDLRHAQERETKKNVFADSTHVDYHSISLINPSAAGSGKNGHLGELYIGIIEGAQAELLHIMGLLAEDTGHTALFHCAAGKDRTGVVAALLLDLAGVPHETIAEDYALTAPCLAPIMDELRCERPAAVAEEVYERLLGCEPANIQLMLEHIEHRYGGTERYLLAIGLNEIHIQRLRDKLVGS